LGIVTFLILTGVGWFFYRSLNVGDDSIQGMNEGSVTRHKSAYSGVVPQKWERTELQYPEVTVAYPPGVRINNYVELVPIGLEYEIHLVSQELEDPSSSQKYSLMFTFISSLENLVAEMGEPNELRVEEVVIGDQKWYELTQYFQTSRSSYIITRKIGPSFVLLMGLDKGDQDKDQLRRIAASLPDDIIYSSDVQMMESIDEFDAIFNEDELRMREEYSDLPPKEIDRMISTMGCYNECDDDNNSTIDYCDKRKDQCRHSDVTAFNEGQNLDTNAPAILGDFSLDIESYEKSMQGGISYNLTSQTNQDYYILESITNPKGEELFMYFNRDTPSMTRSSVPLYTIEGDRIDDPSTFYSSGGEYKFSVLLYTCDFLQTSRVSCNNILDARELIQFAPYISATKQINLTTQDVQEMGRILDRVSFPKRIPL